MSDASIDGFGEIWNRLLADRDATAADLEAEGFEVLTLEPGDVTTVPTASVEGDRIGLDLLVPGNEYRKLSSFVDDLDFDSFDAYRAVTSGFVLLVVAVKATAAKRAVCYPAFYPVGESTAMIEAARAVGKMRTYVRPLSADRHVSFRHDDVEPLLPPADS